MFDKDFMLFIASDGDAIQERFIKDNYTRIDFLSRVLFKQVKNLKDLESTKKS